jgi:uncharacterized membrane protein YhhN
MKKNLFTFLFILSIIGVFTGILLHVKWLDYLSKPLVMISIGGHFLLKSKTIDKNTVILAVFAFLFSLSGDSFLMFPSNGMKFFILGLASFLIAQIFYIFLFRQTIKLSGKPPFLRNNKIFLIAFVLYGATIYTLLFNHLDSVLKIAVFFYMTAILGMSAMALNRFRTISFVSFSFVFIGSVLFVLSDTIIAIDKFYSEIPYNRIFVMSTYIAAQFLIMRGLLKQFE